MITIRLSDVIGLIDIVGSYIIFGLALYSMSGIFMILRARLRDRSVPKAARHDLITIYICLMAYMFIEACRQVWDSFRPDHFPIWPSRVFLIILLPMTGNAAYRLYHRRDEWMNGGGAKPPQQVQLKRKPTQQIQSGYGRPLYASMLSSSVVFLTKWSPLALVAEKLRK